MDKKTYLISTEDSARKYWENPEFRKFIESAGFLYVDGLFVINDCRWVESAGKNRLKLTDKARLYPNECCIRFDLNGTTTRGSLSYSSIKFDSSIFPENDKSQVPVFYPDSHNQKVLDRAKDSEQFKRQTKEVIEFCMETSNYSFCQTAFSHITTQKGHASKHNDIPITA